MRFLTAIKMILVINVSVSFISLLANAKSAFDQTPSPMRTMHPFAEPFPEDNFLVFLENLTSIVNINQLQEQGLAKGKANVEPWAGSYWPIHQGLLGLRFADKTFPRSKDFATNLSHYQSKPSEVMLYSGEMNQLSPAEKYDLLVGDRNWSLTRSQWNRGIETVQEWGAVPGWTGICHGWAAVTHVGWKKPERSITLTDVTGTYRIQFHPDDVAAIVSYLWAENPPEAFLVGQRCRLQSIRTDAYGRPLDPTCLDSNPMSWHLAITNKVGLHGASFAMDTSYNSEVWNYPVSGYDYNYFNPRTFEPSHSLKAAVVPISALTTDKYSANRSPRAKYVVGVSMEVYYPALVSARVGIAKENTMSVINFIYDLELDENYNIIGGEWYSGKRPDFLWTFANDGKAYTYEDEELTGTWDTTQRIPHSFAEKARRASQRGEVLGKIAEAIHKASLVPTAEPIDPVSEADPVDIPPETGSAGPGPEGPGARVTP